MRRRLSVSQYARRRLRGPLARLARCATLPAWRSRRPITTRPASRSGSSRRGPSRSPARPSAIAGSTRSRSEQVDRVRRLLCHEPRGHADMYGCFLVPPDDDGADLGVLFWHKDGYSTACGHGTIALGAWAVRVGPGGGARRRRGDGHDRRALRAGDCDACARAPARSQGVAFRNVPSFVVARGVAAAGIEVDVAYGGAIYAFAPAASCGPARRARGLAGADRGRPLRSSANSTAPRSRAIRTTIGCRASTGRSSTRRWGRCTSGRWRSSPTARSTVRPPARRPRRGPRCCCDDGSLGDGDTWRADSIVGTTFHARAIGRTRRGPAHRGRGDRVSYRRAPLLSSIRATRSGTGFVLR